MARLTALETPFLAPAWRRIAVVMLGLVIGLVLFAFGLSYTGTVLCGTFFWLGYELLVVYDVDTGRRRK